MQRPDVILIHAPSIFEDRDISLLPVPSGTDEAQDNLSQRFREMLQASCYLKKNGHMPRIVDLPGLMAQGKLFNKEKHARSLNAELVIIEAEDVIQVPGAIETSRTMKKLHPKTKVLVYGSCLSTYHKELMDCSSIDMVIRGGLDRKLAEKAIGATRSRRFSKVDSLVWKDRRGNVHENMPVEQAPSVNINVLEYYEEAISQQLRYKDSGCAGLLRKWMRHPATSIYKTHGEEIYRTPEDVYFDIVEMSRFCDGDIHIKGDIRLPGKHFAERLLSLLQHKTVNNVIVFEIRDAADVFYFHEISRSVPRFRLKIVAGSHDEKLRRSAGCMLSNYDLEATIAASLIARPVQTEVLFFTGICRQTPDSVGDTVNYCEYLLRRFDGDRRLSVMLAPCRLPPDTPLDEALERYGYMPYFNPSMPGIGESYREEENIGAGDKVDKMSAEQVAVCTCRALSALVRLRNKYGQMEYREAENLAMDYESAVKIIESGYAIVKNRVDYSRETNGINSKKIKPAAAINGNRKMPGLYLLSRPQNMIAVWRGLNKSLFHTKSSKTGV